MDNFVITQKDWEIERDRLVSDLKSGEYANTRAAEYGILVPMESFFRMYYCCLALGMRKSPEHRGDIVRGGHKFLQDLALWVERSLDDGDHSDNDEHEASVRNDMKGLNAVLDVLTCQLPPEGTVETPKDDGNAKDTETA